MYILEVFKIEGNIALLHNMKVMIMCLFLRPNHYLKGQFILARMCPIFERRAGSKISRAEPSRAERPPARAESELNRAELSSDASLVNSFEERIATIDL